MSDSQSSPLQASADKQVSEEIIKAAFCDRYGYAPILEIVQYENFKKGFEAGMKWRDEHVLGKENTFDSFDIALCKNCNKAYAPTAEFRKFCSQKCSYTYFVGNL